MTKRELERLQHQERTLVSLGFTQDEAAALRRISMTLQRWHELECGTDQGCIERDGENADGKPFMTYERGNGPRGRYAISDREAGAKKRLAAIIGQRNKRAIAEKTVCPNCGQWQHAGNGGDCLNECIKRGFAPERHISPFIQTDPRGAALYIIRPGDVPAGEDVSAYYSRGICVY